MVQRTCHVRLISDGLAAFVFWGWQAVIVAAAVTLPLGITQGKEYAELEWPIDLLIAVVWVAYAVLFFGTIAKRRVKHIYVANWFFGALHHHRSRCCTSSTTSRSRSARPSPTRSTRGAVDAMVQWWYGHNAVGFFLTAGFLGMMYYFVPKQAGRPVYSYRLSIVHFWALIAIYMWAGPHHLHYTALPDWAQSLGMVFSLILLAPSWGGAINGIMTLSGVWHKLRTDPILKFLIVALSLLHDVDLRGADDVDQDGQLAVALHRLDHRPRAFRRAGLGGDDLDRLDLLAAAAAARPEGRCTRRKWIDAHFWLHTIGVVFYIASMWIAGVMQGLMWRATNADGTLTYTFVESLNATYPYYLVRLGGGLLVLSGMLLMAWNVWKTLQHGASRQRRSRCLPPDAADARA